MWKLITVLSFISCSLLSEAEVLKGVTTISRPYTEQKNGKLEGFTMDLIKEIADIAAFNYTVELIPDGKYGTIVNNTMVGMIGEVHYNRADFAIADITVTDVRKEYVEFTEPFMETGLTILVHKNNAEKIHSFRDLSEQTDIQFGAILMGSTFHQLSESSDPTMVAIYRYMNNNPANLMKNLREGVERVNTTNYAFIVEKTFAEYVTGINCDLTFIDDPNNSLLPRQYAIALNKDSNYTERFNSAIRQLKTSGKIESLRNRYWKKCGVLYGVTVPYPPYVEMGINKKDGFVFDLVKQISLNTNLKMRVGLTPDGSYGVVNQHGEINGMIGEVHTGRADFAIADITVTEVRKRFVDFTEPFMGSRLAILIRREYANNISSFSDLAEQTAVPFGTLKSGSTNQYFSQSNDSTIKKMYQYIEANPSNYVRKNRDGIERVRTSQYAFIMESATADYVAGKFCDLVVIGYEDNYGSRQYALAVPKNSIYLETLNKAIRDLKESGAIDTMKNRYFKKCGVLTGVTVQQWMSADLIFGKVEGFVVDLMNSIAEISGFKYSLYFAPDGKHGAFNGSKINGMFGEVIRKRADFAIADLTVTDSRRAIVDFTEPFMETGLVILINKEYAHNISSFADLSEQTLIPYGIMRNGSTHELFARSNDSTIQKMYQYLEANPNNYFKRYPDGGNRLMTSPFAMIVERPFAEIAVAKICELTFIVDPNRLFPRQYAIALPKGSVHLDTFNTAIRQLRNSGRVDTMLKRYRKTCGVLKGVTVSNKPIAEISNGMITGFAVDLMNEISAINNFSYSLTMQYDNRYGGYNGTDAGGMIGEVYRSLADFAVADITVTDGRKQMIDFTEPFFDSAVVLIIHKNNANNINSFSDLAQQTNIKYGLLKHGSTYKLFEKSSDPTISQLFRKMSESPDVYLSSYREGIQRISDNSTGYAFFGERLFAQYLVGENCNLTFIADPVHPFPLQYAIVLPKNSLNTPKFNSAISQLKTNGVMDSLKAKYWKTCHQ